MTTGKEDSKAQAPRWRVLEITGAWGLGGSEQAIQLRSLLLDKSRYEVLALGLEAGGPRLDHLKKSGIATQVCDGSFSALEKVVSDFKPHLISYGRSSSYCKLATEISRLAIRYNTSTLVETNVFGRPALDRLERRPDIVAHMSGASFLKCARAMNATSSQLYAEGHTIVYLPVPTTLYAESQVPTDKLAARKSLGLDPADFVACRVARPDIRKWSSQLEVALPQLFKTIPHLKFVFQALPEEKKRTLQRRFGSRVVCLEPTAEIQLLAQTYVASDVMIHSSGIGESYGLCMAEAMYFGLPVIVDSTPELDNAQVELVSNEQTGYVVRSSGGFVTAAKQLAENRDLLAEMGTRAKEVARQFFVDVEIAKQWDKIFSTLLTPAGSSGQHRPPQPVALVVSEEDYQKRLLEVWGPNPRFTEKVGRSLLRFSDTVKYARQVGLSKLTSVLLARIRAGKISRS